MKKIFSFSILFIFILSLTSCFKEFDKTFDEKTLVEFQDAITKTKAVGKTFPIISYTSSADTTVRAQVNLVGAQRSTDLQVNVSVDAANTTAENGGYEIKPLVFPANSSIAMLEIVLKKVAASSGKSVTLTVQLDGNGSDVLPSENFKKLGFGFKH
ncbi:MAG TPA: hypothetical protein PK006_08435 [Saprospiraceae bacterium]|nr:hypothetical protein [Saprospiraceae bacterium]